MSDAIGLELERRERPFHVTVIAAGEKLAETIGPGAARAVPLNEAAERLNDALAMQARIEALTAEVAEQARLLGASGSREAELMARVEALTLNSDALCMELLDKDKRIEALEKAAKALHSRIVDLGREYDVDDCHIINEAIVADIMLLGGEESDLAALLQEPTK